ncbi:PARP-domain-containing protein [Ganoderma leucocontextum]|nr:PARP-domain-containing protein [Ganoderma leucocontextum]
MPPRKKAAAAAGSSVDPDFSDAPAAPTRSSGRARAPSAKAVAVTAAQAAVANGTTGMSGGVVKKTRGKRAREETDTEAEGEGAEEDSVGKPAAKKARASKSRSKKGKKEELDAIDEEDDEGGEGEEEEEEEEKPAAKRGRTAKGKAKTAPKAKAASKGKATKGKATKKGKDTYGDVDMDDAEDEAGDEDEEEEEEEVVKKPASKKPASKKPASKAADKGKGKDLPQKMVTVVKRGKAPPVENRSGWAMSHEVLVTDDGVWDATLNQTDVGNNANKFYVLQLLHPVGNNSQVTLFTCWGRVGETGGSQKKGPWPPSQAIVQFKEQFKAKAAVPWEKRVGMVQKKGKYQWIEKSYGDEDDEEEEANVAGSSKKEEEKVPDTTLCAEIQQLIRLIFNQTLFATTLSSLNYDANKLPLGKLAKSTILNGFSALKALSEVISQPDGPVSTQNGGFRQAVEHLTNRYYSIIPHVFGRDRPIVIDTLERLKRELELVDVLGDMEIATQLLSSAVPKDAAGHPVNPLDANFRSLALSRMDPVARGSREFGALEAYTRDTHGATHMHFGAQVLNAFRVEREGETRAWNDAGFGGLDAGERLLLWHGSRTTNFAGILKQGLRIAPPEAPVTGYMFGKGVYFADMMSKSANYCHSYLSDDTGLLLLCEVAAKPFFEQHDANYNADQDCKKAGAKATKGLGLTQPAEWQDAGDALDHPELKGCHMPKGPGKDVSDPKGYLQYNEYIVYDSSQIRLRYLLMVKMQ